MQGNRKGKEQKEDAYGRNEEEAMAHILLNLGKKTPGEEALDRSFYPKASRNSADAQDLLQTYENMSTSL
jgi:hypothetical protein